LSWCLKPWKKSIQKSIQKISTFCWNSILPCGVIILCNRSKQPSDDNHVINGYSDTTFCSCFNKTMLCTCLRKLLFRQPGLFSYISKLLFYSHQQLIIIRYFAFSYMFVSDTSIFRWFSCNFIINHTPFLNFSMLLICLKEKKKSILISNHIHDDKLNTLNNEYNHNTQSLWIGFPEQTTKDS